MNKLVKISRVVDTIVKIVRGVCIGAAIACAVLFVIALVLPASEMGRLVSASDMTVGLGPVRLQLTRPLEAGGSLRPFVYAMLGICVPVLALMAWCAHLLHRVLLPMSEGRPFDGTVSGTLRKLGWAALVTTVAAEVMETALTALEVGLYDLDELFAPGLVSGYTVGFNVGDLAAPVLILLLSYVFRYGEELQRQSDETL